MILKEENTKTYQKGYNKCKEDVLGLIDELDKKVSIDTFTLEKLKSKITGQKVQDK